MYLYLPEVGQSRIWLMVKGPAGSPGVVEGDAVGEQTGLLLLLRHRGQEHPSEAAQCTEKLM